MAQEAFLRFVRSGRSPREGKPLAYLFTIARNLCIDAARVRRLPVGPLDVDVPDGSPDADPAMAIGGGEVGALVDALSPELRDVLGVSRFAVNRRLNRALAELRRGLEGKDEA